MRLSFFAYDTLCQVQIQLPGDLDTNRLLEGARSIALEVEQTLSMFDPESELSRLCRGYAPGTGYPVSEMLFTFLERNLEIAALSDGAFDPTVGALVKRWNFLGDRPQPLEDAEITMLLEQVGYHHVALSGAERSVTFHIPGIQLDPGASGKGFALELVVDYLRGCGVTAGVVDFGGNLFVIGEKAEEGGEVRPWKVAIQNPDRRDSLIGTVELWDRGISTSSWYEHCFQEEGKVYHHLLDPRTGTPKPLELKSVSILSSKGMYTDLLSTAFFIMGEERGAQLLDQLKDQDAQLDYVAVRQDGTVAHSAGAQFAPTE